MFDASRMVRDYGGRVFRSERLLKSKGTRVERLLILCEDQAAVLYEGDEVRVYARTAEAGEKIASEFRRYRVGAGPGEDRGSTW